MGQVQKIENTITEGVIWKQLLKFFFPIMFGTFFQQLYNMADAIIVGNFVGKEALAAVGGTTGTLINLLVGFFVGLSAGASVIISQYFGAKDKENLSKSVHTSIALGLVGGAILGIVGFIVAPIALSAMNVPDDIMTYSLTYIRIYFLGVIPMSLYNISSGILRAVGDSKRPLYYLIVACLTNIVLDILLVAILKWGVGGAAIATITSQAVSAILTCYVLMRTKGLHRLELKKIRFHKIIFIKTIQIGVPAGLQTVMYAFSNILIQAGVNSFGTDVIAAVAIFDKTDGLFWMVIGACGMAVTTFVGQNYGAHKMERVHKSVKIGIWMGMGISLSFSVLFGVFGEYVMRIFTDDLNVIQIGIKIFYIIAPTYFTFVLIEVLSGALRGAGNTILPTIMIGVGICVLRVVWMLISLPLGKDVYFIMICYPVSWIITSIMFLIYYTKSKWTKIHLFS